LTDRSTVAVDVQKVVGAQASAVTDSLATEEPLEIQLGYEKKGWHVHKSISVTMRTPGHDFELAAGFLFTEGILRRPDQIAQIRSEPADAADGNSVRIELKPDVVVDWQRLERHCFRLRLTQSVWSSQTNSVFCGTAVDPAIKVKDKNQCYTEIEH
jgi:formate dehydrogenase assembly factor FdhD